MEKFFIDAQNQLQNGLFPDAVDELNLLTSLFNKADVERVNLAKWEFNDNHQAYIAARILAGEILYSEKPQEYWKIIRVLIKSEDLYDRDAAFYSLCEVNDNRKFKLIRSLLYDDYLRFEAIDFLIKNKQFLIEIIKLLNQLCQSNDQKIRILAEQKMSLIEQSGQRDSDHPVYLPSGSADRGGEE